MINREYEKTSLPNGLTVVSEHVPGVRSVSVGVWIKTGTRYESEQNNGVAHFLEHMMFKGTGRKTPRQIVRSIETLGGNLNAFTTKEQTCYLVDVLDEHLGRALDVLGDILNRSGFEEPEVEKERGVILDEILMVEDTPDEMIMDMFSERMFPGHGLGLPILGTPHSLKNLNKQTLLNFYQQHYRNGNVLIAAAGNVKHHQLVKMCERYFKFVPGETSPAPFQKAAITSGRFEFKKPISQAHVCLGVPSFEYNHPKRFEALLLNTILGGGMGSRLFQNIREKYGIAYGIYSFLDFYYDYGSFGIYLGTDMKNLNRSLKLLEREFDKLRRRPVPMKELEEAKSQLRGSLVLALESASGRMNRLATIEMYTGIYRSIDAIIEEINSVSREALYDTTLELLNPEKFLTLLFVPKN
ncbi:MAG: M16 family metallopeptidase [Calditrichia bacterium]